MKENASSRDAQAGTSNKDGTQGIRGSNTGPNLLDGSQLVFPSHQRLRVARQEPLSSVKVELVQDFILEGLRFTAMTDREEEVSAAHRKTFDWIFQEHDLTGSKNCSRFPVWLAKDTSDSVFWVNGKAGSGKSTLMRYIRNHPDTLTLLKKWSGEKPVTTAGFYFWTSGSMVQRSQTGLLRYLLFQLLSKHQDMIAIVLPQLWMFLINASTQERIRYEFRWSQEELSLALNKFLDEIVSNTKICLFIDGLDEFDGNHESIIDFFRSIAVGSKGNVKICLSSRPWPVFETAFSTGPCLKLQDLTRNDMTTYASDKLSNDARVRRLMKKSPEAGKRLLAETVNRADGVFLYLILAIKYLLASPSGSPSIETLETHLAALPRDLDLLFGHILFIMQCEDARETSSKMFQLIRAREIVSDAANDDSSSAFLSLWDIYLAINQTAVKALESPVSQALTEEILSYCTATQELLADTCAGLLIVHSKSTPGADHGLRFADSQSETSAQKLASSKVTFLHRTIRDWLLLPSTWNQVLIQTAGTNFDPHFSLLLSTTLQYRLLIDGFEAHRRLTDWWPSIVQALTHARYIQPELSHRSTELIKKFDSTISLHWASRNGDHWARSAFGTYEEREKRQSIISNPFLCLCVKFGLTTYIRKTLLQNPCPYHYEGGAPLLSYALEMLISRRYSLFPLSSIEMIELLISQDQNPNEGYKTFAGKHETPWMKALNLVREAVRRGWVQQWDISSEGVERWVAILRLLVDRGGADTALVIPETKFDPEITAVEVLAEACRESVDGKVRALWEMMMEIGG